LVSIAPARSRAQRRTARPFRTFGLRRIAAGRQQRTAAHRTRAEDFVRDGQYVLRAELPGCDPEQDLDVGVESHVLTLQAERRASEAGKYHSHFRYGPLCSHVTLPAGIDDNDVTATYLNGILEVSMGFESEHAARRITVMPVRGMP
jgi:HSP20 family protein